MLIYAGVFVLQMSYIIIKFMGIRHIVGKDLKSRLVITGIANVVWLASTSLGVNQVIKEDYFVFVPYVVASIVGTLIEDKIRRKI